MWRSDEHIVFFCENVRRLCKYDGSKGCVIDVQARCELAAPSGNLDDAVRFRVGKGLERGINCSDRSHIDGRIGVVTLLGGIEHRFVLCWCGYWHF